MLRIYRPFSATSATQSGLPQLYQTSKATCWHSQIFGELAPNSIVLAKFPLNAVPKATQYWVSDSMEGQDFTIYQCKNGLTDAASPLIIDGKHLANILIGQFHLQEPDLDFFRRQARDLGYDEEDYLAFHQGSANHVPREKLPSILGLLARLRQDRGLPHVRPIPRFTRSRGTEKEGRGTSPQPGHGFESGRGCRNRPWRDSHQYRDHLEQLVKDGTEELRVSEERTRLLLGICRRGDHRCERRRPR